MTIDATTGNDVLSGGNEVDTIDALAGADLVTGGSGDDNLQGGLSSDVLAGGAGSDVVVGGDGNDIVFGSGPPAESLRDVLLQNWITYTLNGLRFAAWADDGEADVLSGGSGNDVLWLDLRESVTGVSLDFAVDPNAVASAALGADVTGFETFNVLAGDFNDTISRGGVTVATQLAGGNGADTLTGGNGGDVLDSGSFLWGGADDGHVDTLYGNSGSDTFHLGRGDVADGGVGSDTAYIYFSGLAVGEVLRLTVSDATAVADIQNASGGAYTTIERFGIVGTAGDDAIQGGNSVSNILGGGGNDTLTSAQSASNVNVYGEAGDDVIEMSGPYAATAYGGAGSDTITVIQRQGIVFHSDAVAAGAGLASLDDGAADTIVTGTQLDTVTIGLGDSADGGASNDTLVVYFVAAESGVNVDLSVNAASSLTTAVGGTIRNFELYALHGGAHNDTFIANAAATTLAGGEGTDVLTGGGSGDLLYHNLNSTTHQVVTGDLQTYEHRHSIDDGDVDTLTGGGGSDTVYAGAGDHADGGIGTDVLYITMAGAGAGVTLDMSLDINAGLSAANGSTIADFEAFYVAATHHNDTIVGATGVHAIYGLGGDDHITTVDNGSYPVIGGDGADTIIGSDGVNLIVTGADAYFRNDANDTLAYDNHMDTDADTVSAGAGNDTIHAGYGDSIDGGAGNDLLRLYLGGATSGVTLDMTDGANEGVSAALGATVQNIEGFVILGSTHNDDLTVDATTTALRGMAGDDTLTIVTGSAAGNEGNDTLTAAALDDSVSITLSGDDGDDTLSMTMGIGSLNGGAGNDTLTGGRGNDSLTGGNGNDSVNGGGGNDTLFFSAGSGHDVADRGEGVDRLYFLMNRGAYNVVAHDGAVTVTFADGSVSGANIETVQFYDGLYSTAVIAGTAGADTLNGTAIGDTLNGGEGDDTLVGGAGADAHVGGEGLDTASYADSLGGVEVNLATSVHAGDAEGDTFDGIEVIVGTAEGDYLIGHTGNDTFVGGDGYDDLHGSFGDDTLSGGLGEDFLFGGSGNDNLSGGEESDSLRGDTGDDTLMGGAGGDELIGGDDFDTASYANASTGVSINLGTGLQSGDAEGDTFDGVEAILGNAFMDTLAGSAANDSLSGADGGDYLYGDDGDDLLDGGDGGGTLDGGEGDDTVLGGSGNDDIQGGGRDDVLNGGSGVNYIGGGDGNDTLIGGLGQNQLSGYGGFDTVSYAEVSAGVEVDLDAGETGGGAVGDVLYDIVVTVTIGGSTATLTGVERLQFDDQSPFVGQFNPSTITGTAGIDTVSDAESDQGPITVRLWGGCTDGGDATGQ